VDVVVTDIHNNKSKLSFKIKSDNISVPKTTNETSKNLKVMPYNKSNRFISDGISVTIPNGALYDTLYFDYKKRPGTKVMLSDVYEVHNKYTPLHKSYTLQLKPHTIPSGRESKMLIAQMSDDMKKSAMSSKWEDGYLRTESGAFGNFFISIDTVPPVISANGLVSGANLTGKKEIRIRITDDFSGIKSYDATIDDKFALFEYDPKNYVLIYKFDQSRISKGSTHNLILTVNDNTDNKSYFNCDFTW
jgi:hypothetical protein